MNITAYTKMVQCIYDESKRKIHFNIDIPLEDNNISSKQLMRAIHCLVGTVERFDRAFRSAIDLGEERVSSIISKTQKQAQLSELIKNASAEEIESLVQQLEFSDTVSDIKQGEQRVLN